MQAYHAYRQPTAEALHDQMTHELVWEQADQRHTTDVQNHNVIGVADTFDFRYDLASLWHSERRWNQLVREYVDPEALDLLCEGAALKLVHRKRGVAVMRSRTQTPRRNQGAAWRTWGSCMLAWSFRQLPVPTFAMHSRASYLGFLGPMDVAVAHCIAEEVGQAVGLATGEMRFVWHLEVAQFHGFKGIAWHLTHPETDLVRYPDYGDGARMVNKTLELFERLDEEGVQYGDMPYGQIRRARKRWHVEVRGMTTQEADYAFGNGGHRVPSQNKAFRKLPPMHAQDLTFGCLDGWVPSGEARTMVEHQEEYP